MNFTFTTRRCRLRSLCKSMSSRSSIFRNLAFVLICPCMFSIDRKFAVASSIKGTMNSNWDSMLTLWIMQSDLMRTSCFNWSLSVRVPTKSTCLISIPFAISQIMRNTFAVPEYLLSINFLRSLPFGSPRSFIVLSIASIYNSLDLALVSCIVVLVGTRCCGINAKFLEGQSVSSFNYSDDL
jgi:hypothetical protein